MSAEINLSQFQITLSQKILNLPKIDRLYVVYRDFLIYINNIQKTDGYANFAALFLIIDTENMFSQASIMIFPQSLNH